MINEKQKEINRIERLKIKPIPSVKKIIGVSSGKGGVGKSTTAANLAISLSKLGFRVGVLDADIYGPSQPTLFGINTVPEIVDGKFLKPVIAHGIQVMSIGFLVDKNSAMVWRGPMVSHVMDQLLKQTLWDDVDYLVIDMPPGTGDIQMALVNRVKLDGVVVVTTPQDVALMDVRKGITMFTQSDIRILGLIENMAIHICSSCGHAEHIFGESGGKDLTEEIGIEFLGSLPLDINIRVSSDSGQPISLGDNTASKIYSEIGSVLLQKVQIESTDEHDLDEST
jgi:ATP-binding protein involved in chromosome partitioning